MKRVGVCAIGISLIKQFMSGIKNILLATDFSENSASAESLAVNFVKRSNAKFSLVNVYNQNTLTYGYTLLGASNDKHLAPNLRPIAREKLKKIIIKNGLNNHPHRCFVRPCDVNEEVLKLISHNPINLAFLGSRFYKKGTVPARGSVAMHMMNYSTCPVIIVPKGGEKNDLSKIIYATDEYDNEASVINYMLHFADIYNASLTVVYVYNLKSFDENTRRDLVGILNRSNYPKIEYKEMFLASGQHGILDYAEESGAGILSMKTQKKSLTGQLFHRNTAQEILVQTHIPLLTFNDYNKFGYRWNRPYPKEEKISERELMLAEDYFEMLIE